MSHHGYSLFHLGWRQWWAKVRPRIVQTDLRPGMRVRLRSAPFGIILRKATGTVVGPAEYEDYFLVRLDEPACDERPDGSGNDLPIIREDAANLEVVRGQ
jgi:hypothetical protein